MMLMLTALGLLWPWPARVQAQLRAQAPPGSGQSLVLSKVDRVLVYSTEARVFREATVTLGGGPLQAGLADLPESALGDSVRVESRTARVRRVEVTRSQASLPRQARAMELVKKIEAALDRMRDQDSERRALQAEIGLLDALILNPRPPQQQGRGPAQPEGIFADAWRRILTWMEARSARIRPRLLELARERHNLANELDALRVEARALDPRQAEQDVSRVVATLEGARGRHRVVVSYRVPGVRWLPSYDLRYDPASRGVEAVYYARVRQSTGEDWTDARLRFSTGLPTQIVAIPELPTLVLGRRRDFTPRPGRITEELLRPWVPLPPVRVEDPVLARLREVLGEGQEPSPQPKEPARPDVSNDLEATGEPEQLRRPESKMSELREKLLDSRERVRAQKSSLKAKPEEPTDVSADMAAPPPSAPPPRVRPSVSYEIMAGSSSDRQVPTESLPWTDTGYVAPELDQDLPAASARGYRFVLHAPGRNTVEATGTDRRVPLLRTSLKVRPVYRILPGKSPYAYLMAELTNTTGRPILRGHANLFSGSMFAGRSWLNTSLPGRKLRLPLGVDDAVKVERNLHQKTVVEGLVFKDDVTEYRVEIEIANHRRYSVEVDLRDQLPVKLGKKVEIKEFRSWPTMTRPDDEGRVRWEGTVGPSSVKKLTFSFRIVRPKDWELSQQGG